MKISSRPPAMAGAVVPAQLYSGRPRAGHPATLASRGPRCGDPSCRKLRPLEYGSPLAREDTRWLSAALAAGSFVSSLHLDPPSHLRVSFHVRLRLIFACRLPRRVRVTGRCPLLCRPQMRDGGAPGRVTGIPVAHARRDALPPVRREGASRRSTWRFSAARPALRLPAVPTGIRAATSPAAGHNVPTARSRASRGRGSLRRLGTPLPAPPSGRHRRRPARAR
jgi:hypothetical protein